MSRQAKPRFHEGNGRWCAKIGPPGRDGRPTVVYFPKEVRDEADAWDYFRQYRSRVAEPGRPAAELEVDRLAEMYLEWAEAEARAGRIEAHAWKNKVSHLKHLLAHVPAGRRDPLAYLRVADLDASHVNGLVRSMQAPRSPGGEPFSPHYIANVVRTVVAMLNWAAQPIEGRDPARLLDENPIRGWKPGVALEHPEKYADAKVIRAFRRWAWSRARWGWIGPDAAARLAKAGRIRPTPAIRRKVDRRFDRIFLLMVRFIAFTGCRPKEACHARWADVRWDDESRARGTISLDRWKNKKKTGKKRVIFITPPVARILRAIGGIEGRHEEWIFTHRVSLKSPRYSEPGPHRLAGEPWLNGTTLGAKLRKFRTWAIEAGVRSSDGVPVSDAGPGRLVNYLFRHTYISDLLMGGATPSEVATLTGTSTEMVERRYGHIQKDHLARLADRQARKGRGS